MTPRSLHPRSRLVAAAVAGVLAGFVSGLFGVGGGVLMVPALVLAVHLDQRLAHGVSLTAVVPIAAASTLSYALAGEVDWSVAVLLAIGAIGGAVVGTHLLARLAQRVLGYCFAALMIATAVRLLFEQGASGGRSPLTVAAAVALVVVGALSGILAGLLGVGGGIVMVPAMVVGLGMPAAVSKGTSLAVIIPTALMGTWRNVRNGNTDLPIAAAAGLAGMASAFVGGKVSIRMPDGLSNSLFAALLGVMTLQLLARLWRERGSGSDAAQAKSPAA